MGGDPEDGPVFAVAPAHAENIGHVAALGKVGVLDLFALAPLGVDDPIATAFETARRIAAASPHAIRGAKKLLNEVPDLDTLVLSVGGGGLIAGMATAAKALRLGIEVIGVQTSRFPAT